MIELKAIRSGEIHDIIDYEDWSRTDDLYYPKSEADKVIAELKKEKEYVIEHTVEVINGQEREIRHQKYKRCLANAEACWHKRWRPDEGFYYARSTRHMKRWIEIAEKFKEAK